VARNQRQQQATPPSAARRPRPSVISRLLDDNIDEHAAPGPSAAAPAFPGQQARVSSVAVNDAAVSAGAAAEAVGPAAVRPSSGCGAAAGTTPRKEGRSHLAALASRFLD
jgi:hypothetical protein